jgi:predicted O-methyltransferase YrrM
MPVALGTGLKFQRAKRVDGNTTEYEQRILATLVQAQQPKEILEIGTFNGLSTATMALNSQARISTIDIEASYIGKLKLPIVRKARSYDDVRYIAKEAIGQHYKKRPFADRITQLLCDSALLQKCLKRKFDFIFIDGSHSYEYTRSDTKYALAHVRRGGTILWHDYGKKSWPGVTKVVDDLYTGGQKVRRIPRTSFAILQT